MMVCCTKKLCIYMNIYIVMFAKDKEYSDEPSDFRCVTFATIFTALVRLFLLSLDHMS